MTKDRGTILIVDDEPANLNVLEAVLGRTGYALQLFPSPVMALEAAEEIDPDLFLLDIRMPEMDGYELCEKLKSIPSLLDVPVIFVSALGSRDDVVRGFKVGAVDYITKPFNAEEVHARIQTHIDLRRSHVALNEQHKKLVDNYERLREAENMRDNLVHMVAHDMKSLLQGAHGFVELAIEEMGAHMPAEPREYLQLTLEAVDKLNAMIIHMVDVSRWEAGRMPLYCEAMAAVEIVNAALESLGGALVERRVNVEIQPDMPIMTCDREVIRRVLVNLIDNANKYAPMDTPVTVAVSKRKDQVKFAVTDCGRGIPPDMVGRIFDKFIQSSDRRRGHSAGSGLGLAFCKLAVEAHGGNIAVDTTVAGQCTFWFTLPPCTAAKAH